MSDTQASTAASPVPTPGPNAPVDHEFTVKQRSQARQVLTRFLRHRTDTSCEHKQNDRALFTNANHCLKERLFQVALFGGCGMGELASRST